MTKDLLRYAADYQAKRPARCDEKGAVFLPMELLQNKSTDELHLSVSFSGTGYADTYFSQRVSLYRAVKITRKWLIVPTTVSRLFAREQFLERFGDLLESDTVDGEDFWVLREDQEPTLRSRIRELELDNSFREMYTHAYAPENTKG